MKTLLVILYLLITFYLGFYLAKNSYEKSLEGFKFTITIFENME